MVLTTVMMIAIKNAAPKEAKPKFCCPTKNEVICNIKPLITKLKSPNVKSVRGNDKTVSTGFTSPFKSERTKLATKAIQKLRT